MLAFGLSLLGGWMARAADEAPMGVFFPSAVISSTKDTSTYSAWFFTMPSVAAEDDFVAKFVVTTNLVSKSTNQRVVGAANADGLLHFFMAFYSGVRWAASAREGNSSTANTLIPDSNAPSGILGQHVVIYSADSSHAQVVASKGDYVYTSPSVRHSFAYSDSPEQITFFAHGSRAMSQPALIWGAPTKPFAVHPMQSVTKSHKGAWSTYNHEFYTTTINE